MRRLTILGEDLSQLAQLAAALQRYFGVVSIVHTLQPLERAAALDVADDSRTVVCLASVSVPMMSASPASVAYVIPAGPAIANLKAAGLQCFAASDTRGLARFLCGAAAIPSRPRRLRLAQGAPLRRLALAARERQRT
ncbi:MAG TPA: hypothetical protein VH951_13550 [Dehalococcoidia bacterium]